MALRYTQINFEMIDEQYQELRQTLTTLLQFYDFSFRSSFNDDINIWRYINTSEQILVKTVTYKISKYDTYKEGVDFCLMLIKKEYDLLQRGSDN